MAEPAPQEGTRANPAFGSIFEAAGDPGFDLIVVGGGVHGICIVLEATRRGLRSLLVEEGDFGSGTSANTLRILHGGLRYLQRLDLPRFRRSVRARRWWMRTLPELVRPLPCLLPLEGRGLARKAVLAPALRLNDLLARDRNREVVPERGLPSSRLLSPEETRVRCPLLEPRDLQGAALWHDAWMVSPHRLQIELLRWAVDCGAVALNYVSATGLIEAGGRVQGVVAHDRVGDEEHEFRAPAVVNAAGPSVSWVERGRDSDLFVPSLAFNLLLDRPPPSRDALAVRPPDGRGVTYFLCPLGDRTLAGTGHVPWPAGRPPPPSVPEETATSFLAALRSGLPGLDVTPADITRHLVGLVPTDEVGSVRLRTRDRIIDHARTGGPAGLVSVSGVKFTTAPAVAREVLGSLGTREEPSGDGAARPPHPLRRWRSLEDFQRFADTDAGAARETLLEIVRDEQVVFMEDLILRRLDWGLEPGGMESGPALVQDLLGQDAPPFLDSQRISGGA